MKNIIHDEQLTWDFYVSDNGTPPHAGLTFKGDAMLTIDISCQEALAALVKRLNLHEQALSLLNYMANDPSCLAMQGDNFAEWKEISASLQKSEVNGTRRSLAELDKLWEQLGDVAVDDDGDSILTSFLHFEPGTKREEIWHWFESQNNAFRVVDVMYGIRRTSTDAK